MHVYVLIRTVRSVFLFHDFLVPSDLPLVKKDISCLGLKNNETETTFSLRNEPENDNRKVTRLSLVLVSNPMD